MRALFPALAVTLIAALPALAANPLTRAEETVCRNIRHCLDIVDRHAPSEFDYSVLASEMMRFRPAQRLRAAKRTDLGEAARENRLDLWRALPDQAQAELAIDLLGDGSEDARTLGLRVLSGGAPGWLTSYRPRSGDLPILLREANRAPTREIFDLLQSFPDAQTQSALDGFILSDDRALSRRALQAKIESDPAASWAMVERLMRDASTLDAALHLAYSLPRDARTEAALRDAAARSSLPDPMQFAAKWGLVTRFDTVVPNLVDPGFIRNFVAMGEGDSHPIRHDIVTQVGPDILPALESLHAARPETTGPILRALGVANPDWMTAEIAQPWIGRALERPQHHQPLIWARRLALLHGVTAHEARFAELALTHPFDFVRNALASEDAQMLIGFFQYDSEAVRRGRTREIYCNPGEPFDARDLASQMPFFEDDLRVREASGDIREADFGFQYSSGAERRRLQTALPTQTAWLAGYDRGEFGGSLIAFDYQDGVARVIRMRNTQFIVPVHPVPLGQTADDIWVMSGLNHMIASGELSRLSVDGDRFDLVKVLDLPGEITSVSRMADDSLILSFHRQEQPFQPENRNGSRHGGWTDNPPPIRLYPDGRVTQACGPASKTAGIRIDRP